jgi:hypothetical protein
MSHYQIKHRRTDAVIYEGEAESLKDLVGTAVGKNISLRNAYLGDADLRNADLRNADLRNADLRNAYLGNAYLRNAYLSNADLRNADLRNADLSNADLRNADLRNADLRNADLRNAYLGGADLSNADLSNADLRNADLRNADLRNADLRNAYLGDADLGDAYHLISFSGIGSARRNTSYWLEADKVWCGCFNGTLEEFRAQVEETHEENPQYLAEYRAGLAFLAACIAAIPEGEKEAGRKAYTEMMAKPDPTEPAATVAGAAK